MNESARFDRIAAYLRRDFLPPAEPAAQRILLGLYRLLAAGRPVTVDRLAAALALSGDAVAAALAGAEASTVQRDDAGAITGYGGLSQMATRHRFRFGDRNLFTWCAFDALFLPELLDGDAAVASTCPVTGTEIGLVVTPAGLGEVRPDKAVMSFVTPTEPGQGGGVRANFCRHVNFFAAPDAADAWLAENTGATIISLDDGFALGRVRNQRHYGDALATL